MARIHQRIAVAETVDFGLQGRRTVLENLNIRMDFVATFDTELTADGRITEIALEGQECHG
jgi:hypothetical protein